ncbi:MAG TPA: hypothetical protein VHV52_01830 [Gaiellaceae bacterium]|nr:hypothetical protein [Gaiellaceae bacterium]
MKQATQTMAVLMIALGVALIVRTLVHGFGVGVLLGLLFIAAGVGRLLLMRRRV